MKIKDMNPRASPGPPDAATSREFNPERLKKHPVPGGDGGIRPHQGDFQQVQLPPPHAVAEGLAEKTVNPMEPKPTVISPDPYR